MCYVWKFIGYMNKCGVTIQYIEVVSGAGRVQTIKDLLEYLS